MRDHLDLSAIVLQRGSHSEEDGEYCLVEAAIAWAGGPWGDVWDESISPVIGAFCRRWNDDLGDADRQQLKPYIPRLAGTATGPADDDRRAWIITDWSVRTYLPAWLRAAKMDPQADAVEALPELTGRASWLAAKATVRSVRRDAARAFAWDVAGDVAWDVARAVARDVVMAVAGAAARAAARSAAWDAAYAAAWDATYAAARDATYAAARDAAWDAARDVDQDAARDVAWDAAQAALRPTVEGLQASAHDLLDRLIAVGTQATKAGGGESVRVVSDPATDLIEASPALSGATWTAHEGESSR